MARTVFPPDLHANYCLTPAPNGKEFITAGVNGGGRYEIALANHFRRDIKEGDGILQRLYLYLVLPPAEACKGRIIRRLYLPDFKVLF
jgi:hypothetical protein